MLEGLLGLLLHITRNLDPQTLSTLKEHSLITIFHQQLNYHSNPRVKQLAIIGLKNLSGYGSSLAAMESERQPPHGLCSHLMFMCGRSSLEPSTCPIHNIPCEEDGQLCLLKSNCIRPLVDLLTDKDTSVQIAAVRHYPLYLWCGHWWKPFKHGNPNTKRHAQDALTSLEAVIRG
ncbi:hypothetical protein M0R45_017431 [Rubus argutus]|uniref:Uncharacterized protein n=1 Tax=Rubus argutus TaxID=59490 RepID=A0AAW1XVN2_RUBAR